MVNKKNWLGILVMLLIFGMTVVGCGEDDSHTHSYSENWSYNATDHWKECSCGDKTKLGSHSFFGSACSVCGYDNGNGNVSLSLTTRQNLSSYDSKYYYTIGIFLNMSTGASWSSEPGITAKSWVTVTTLLDLTDWDFQVDYDAISPDHLVIWYSSPAQSSIISMPSEGITVSIDQTKLSEMKGYTNVTNNLTIGTPSSRSSSAWTTN